MGCMVLCRTIHPAPEQGQGPASVVPYCSGSGPGPCPSTGHSQCDYTIMECRILNHERLSFFRTLRRQITWNKIYARSKSIQQNLFRLSMITEYKDVTQQCNIFTHFGCEQFPFKKS